MKRKRVPHIRPTPMSDGLQEITCPCGELFYSASSFGRCPSCRRLLGFSPPPGRDYQEKFFIAPFVHIPKYDEKVSYDEVFREVQKDINDDVYRWTYSANELKDTFPPDIDLTRLLQSLRPNCPDLFESDKPGAIVLQAHFGRFLGSLRQASHYAATAQEREKAQGDIDTIMGKARDAKWKRIFNPPPLLSLDDMREYLHRITEDLREKCRKYFRQQYGSTVSDWLLRKDDLAEADLNALPQIDRRLGEMVEKDLVEMLVRKPRELTDKIMADFWGVTPGTLGQHLKEEKKRLVLAPV